MQIGAVDDIGGTDTVEGRPPGRTVVPVERRGAGTGGATDRAALGLEAVGNDPYPYSSTLAPSLVFSDVDFSGA